jgi:hypothetical protein
MLPLIGENLPSVGAVSWPSTPAHSRSQVSLFFFAVVLLTRSARVRCVRCVRLARLPYPPPPTKDHEAGWRAPGPIGPPKDKHPRHLT